MERLGSSGHMLKNHVKNVNISLNLVITAACLRVESKYIYLIPAVTLDTTLEYLIPTTT